MLNVKDILSYFVRYGLHTAIPIHPQSVCGCSQNLYDVTILQNIPHIYFKISCITTRGPANFWGVQRCNSTNFSYNDLMIKIAHISLVLQIHALSSMDLLHIDVDIYELLGLNTRTKQIHIEWQSKHNYVYVIYKVYIQTSQPTTCFGLFQLGHLQVGHKGQTARPQQRTVVTPCHSDHYQPTI